MSRFIHWFKQHLPGWRAYWSERGVVPRWQYLCVYVLIVGAGAVGQYETNRIASRANTAVVEIQRSRIEVASTACAQQNERNRAAFAFLQGLPSKPNVPRKEQVRLLHGFTDALVGPHQDCAKLIRQRFGSVR